MAPPIPAVEPRIDPITDAVIASFGKVAAVIQMVLDPFAAPVQARVDPVATIVQPAFDAIALAIQTLRQVRFALGARFVSQCIEPIIDAGTARIQSVVDPVAFGIEALVDSRPSRIETVMEPLASPIEPVIDAVTEPIEKTVCHGGRRASHREQCKSNYHRLLHRCHTPFRFETLLAIGRISGPKGLPRLDLFPAICKPVGFSSFGEQLAVQRVCKRARTAPGILSNWVHLRNCVKSAKKDFSLCSK